LERKRKDIEMADYIEVNPELCTGCRQCEVVCSLYHFGECNPERSAIRVLRRERDGLVDSIPIVCQQCNNGPCIHACPNGAISHLNENGPVIIDMGKCSGCGECLKACPAGCIFMDNKTNRAICCDLCGGEPKCVDLCHSISLKLSRDEEKKGFERAHEISLIIKDFLKGSS
jgi:Fe-S-cluster-containing hydrogenase component 2